MIQLALTIKLLADFYVILIIVYCLFSWVPNKSGVLATIDYAISRLVEPYLNLFRKIIPPFGGIDFSPVLAVLVLQLVVRLIFRVF